MANFVFAYHGGKMPESPEEGAKIMAAWKEWLGSIGESIVDIGAPVGQSKTLSASGVADDGGSNPISGYTIVKADDMDAALALAKGCPILGNDGTVEVAEAMSMDT